MDSASRQQPHGLVADLQRIFGQRLVAVVGYGPPDTRWSRNLALVSSLAFDDLAALAAATRAWHARQIATPLILPRAEFARSVDAFPVEYGEIIDSHTVLFGDDPFEGVAIAPADLRRALEGQAASLLVHLRENYIESGGRAGAVATLVEESAPSFQALVRRMARLDGAPAETAAAVAQWATERAGLDARVVGDVLAAAGGDTIGVDPSRLFPSYLDTLQALLEVIDQWRAR